MILHIARHAMAQAVRDARFLIMAALILIAFITNGTMYADLYQERHEVWRDAVNANTSALSSKAENLQMLSNHRQMIVKPPSALAFIADGGEEKMPNLARANAFCYYPPERLSRDNPRLPLLPMLDWHFIVGIVFGLLAIVLSFDAVCGAKRDGVLRLILSNPVSRASVFLGVFLGYFIALALLFVAGALIDCAILHFAGALPLDGVVVEAVAIAALLSLASVAFTLAVGLAVSAIFKRPAVALIILMLLFTLNIVALPGIGQLLSADSVNVPTSFQVTRDMEEAEGQVWRNTPSEDQNWNGDPKHPGLAPWGAAVKRVLDAKMAVRKQWLTTQALLANHVNDAMAISPYGLFGHGLRQICGTGAKGYGLFLRSVDRYVAGFYNFVETTDAGDPDSPHVIYSWGDDSDGGTFSTKPVNLESVPRAYSLWQGGGLPPGREAPLLHTALLAAAAAVLLFVGLFLFLRYDPR